MKRAATSAVSETLLQRFVTAHPSSVEAATPAIGEQPIMRNPKVHGTTCNPCGSLMPSVMCGQRHRVLKLGVKIVDGSRVALDTEQRRHFGIHTETGTQEETRNTLEITA
ncbi:hypothetical protein DPX16_17400 [Anabarilius grahami]|uniref:Uncharacterized protein n=1 Tax=Anabarilius grahami TaxID=495550 RepID=A0A3N0XYV6_ANAGA|nr:hypothetical protein DPX16_17400 [Anabarilius grahami]